MLPMPFVCFASTIRRSCHQRIGGQACNLRHFIRLGRLFLRKLSRRIRPFRWETEIWALRPQERNVTEIGFLQNCCDSFYRNGGTNAPASIFQIRRFLHPDAENLVTGHARSAYSIVSVFTTMSSS